MPSKPQSPFMDHGKSFEDSLKTPPPSPEGNLTAPEMPPRPAKTNDFLVPIDQMQKRMHSTVLPQSYRMCFAKQNAFDCFYDVHITIHDLLGQPSALHRELLEKLAGWLKECLTVILQGPRGDSTFASVLVSEIVQCLRTENDRPRLDQLAGMVLRMFEEASFTDKIIVFVTLQRYFPSGGNEHDLYRWTNCVLRNGTARGFCKQFAFNACTTLLRKGWACRIMKSRSLGESLYQEHIERQDGIPRWPQVNFS